MGHSTDNMTINGTGGICPIRDVSTVLAITPSGHWNVVCSSEAINKWAMFKPMARAGVQDMTLAERKACRFGLSCAGGSIPALLSALRSEGSAQPAPSSLAVPAWTYTRPSGGDASPYRITDFLDNENPLQTGYRHDASPPDTWEASHSYVDTAFRADTLSFALEAAHVHTSLDGDPTQWHIDAAAVGGRTTTMWSWFTMRLGPASYDTVGNGAPSSAAMPMAYLMGDMLAGSWRLALAVYLPKGVTGSGNPMWMAFCGKKPLSSASLNGQAAGLVIPDLLTNTVLLQAMRTCLDKGQTSFTMLPCLLRNTTLEYNTATRMTRVLLSRSDAALETMPSQTKTVTMAITADPTIGKIVNDSDSQYRRTYYTPVRAGMYKVVRTTVTNPGSANRAVTTKTYKITVTSGLITIAPDSSAPQTFNLSATVSDLTATVAVQYYASEEDYQAGRPSTDPAPVVASPTISTVWRYFMMGTGASTPASAYSFTLSVTPLQYL